MSYTDDQIRQAVDAVFGKYDKDNSGALDKNETCALINDALKQMNSGRQVSEAEVDQFIAAVDTSNDKLIQKPELFQIFKKVLNCK